MEHIDLLPYYDEVLALWQEYAGEEFCTRQPIMPATGLKNSLLFIGLNPSFTEGDNAPYTLSQNSLDGHPYFTVLSRMAERIGMPWSYLDLLCIRETNQKRIKTLFGSKNGNTFAQRQIDIACRIIEDLDPVAVIVCNASACKLLDERVHFDKHFDEETGTYKMQGRAWYLCGMLSGQRALDTGSRARLEWHIRHNLYHETAPE